MKGKKQASTQALKPKRDIAVRIPQPLIVRQESTSEDNHRHTEEIAFQSAQLHLAKRLNQISVVGSVFSLIGLVALYLTIWQSRDTFREGQRAWITISGIKLVPPGPDGQAIIPITAGTLVAAPIVFKNSGLSPALHVRMESDHQTFKGGNACPVPENLSSPYSSEMTVGAGMTPANNNYLFKVNQDCVNELEAGIATFTLQGVITYEDIFHQARHTHFCYRYEGKGNHQMTACQDGNDID